MHVHRVEATSSKESVDDVPARQVSNRPQKRQQLVLSWLDVFCASHDTQRALHGQLSNASIGSKVQCSSAYIQMENEGNAAGVEKRGMGAASCAACRCVGAKGNNSTWHSTPRPQPHRGDARQADSNRCDSRRLRITSGSHKGCH